MKSYHEMLEELEKKLPEKTREKTRFKMPRLDSFIQGKKTMVKNFSGVANQLRADSEHLVKYLSKELATAAEQKGKRLVLKGRFKNQELNKRLKEYISTYVLCPECNKPDTKLITQDGVLFIRCEACGARSPVPVIK